MSALKYMLVALQVIMYLHSIEAALSFPNWLSRSRRQSEAAAAAALAGEVAPNLVDLHNDEFCVDVSTFAEVVFEPTSREKCDTMFVKNCEDRTEQVCDEVTEITCDIVPYTECAMSMELTPYKSFEMIPKLFTKKICTEGMDTVQHVKMMPECRNVTKQNCITHWESDENGNQVWAGNEDCEPVTWRECQLVPRQVDFKVPKVTCSDGDSVPYTDCVDAEKEQMTSAMSCEVKHTTACVPVISTKCKSITFQECTEEPIETCQEQVMMIPMQKKDHKKKCLLQDDGGTPRSGRKLNDRKSALVVQPRGGIDKSSLSSASVSAGKLAALATLTGSESRLHQARPLPVRQQGSRRFQGSAGIPRVGRRVSGQVFIAN